MQPELVKESIAEFHAKVNRLSRDQEGDKARREKEMESVCRQIRKIVEVVKDGLYHASMKTEMDAIEVRRKELEGAIAAGPPPRPRLNPNLAECYRQKVAALHEALADESIREGATETIRSLIEEMRLVPENGVLAIELRGILAAMLSLANPSKKPRHEDATGVQVTLVAGRGFGLYRTRRRV